MSGTIDPERDELNLFERVTKLRHHEWEAYAVGEPSTKANWTNPDCCPFDTVRHICHVPDAFRMFEDGKIRSSLIWDESKLNNTRTCVAWLSPNHWTTGSIYGNIEFDFDWRDLVEGKKFYWVEAIQKYRPPAFRILITDKEPSLDLELYSVEDGTGPLFHDSKKDVWYWNGDMTGEFMIDEDLQLSTCKRVSFGKHHESICRKDGSACPDRRQNWDKAGTRLMARLIAQNVIKPASIMNRLFLDGERFHSLAERVFSQIAYRLSKLETTGSLTHKERPAIHIATALLDRLGTERKLDALASLFSTPEDLEMAIRKRVAKAFDIPLENVPSSADEC